MSIHAKKRPILNTLGWVGSAVLLAVVSTTIMASYDEQNPTIITNTKTITNTVIETEYVHVKSSESYWATLLNVESDGGKNRYRPNNKKRHCRGVKGACGAHQLTRIALHDIGCTTSQCEADRDDYQKSQALALRYDRRLTELGCKETVNWKRYVCWNQGARTALRIFRAAKGGVELKSSILRNMANNAPYSYRKLRSVGSKKAAQLFLKHRKALWQKKSVRI